MSLSSQTKYIDPNCENLPLAIDWANWLAALGPGVALANSVWSVDAPLTGTERTSGTYAIIEIDGNGAPPGTYECVNTVTADNAAGTVDVRRLHVVVRNL